MQIQIVEIIDQNGQLVAPQWLPIAEGVHRQLRPQLPADYAGRLQVIAANGGRLIAAVAGEAVLGLALWRLIENTYEGRRLYVDDLVSDETRRSQGVGKALMNWLDGTARQLHCDVLALDSGVQRASAHKFYFREGLHVSAFNFRKVLQ
ncbi:GNAT family N-acetyltransferase [Andreprevotia chitinilytica]|uniref:GNAT family N-acetyltransferase n=1 Tax=Andreprevotia chitinilytica TaxID=396808 RepID=UPI000B0EDC4D|nr:GNAT family N-acetyltransferase [Andreprevotia chitinilytica]